MWDDGRDGEDVDGAGGGEVGATQVGGAEGDEGGLSGRGVFGGCEGEGFEG